MFVDTFRYFHPNQREAFTNWCTVTSARQTNYGTRIDYIFANVDIVTKQFVDCVIQPDVEGSDHCPVVATLKDPFVAASRAPSLCTKYMPEFAGRQQKLQSYFTNKSGTKQDNTTKSSCTASSSSVTGQTEMSEAPTSSGVKRTAEPSGKSCSAKRVKTGRGKQNCASDKQNKLFEFFGKANTREKCESSTDNRMLWKSSSSDNTSLIPSENKTTVLSPQDKCTDQTEACRDSLPSIANMGSVVESASLSSECSTKSIQEVKKRAEIDAWKSIFKGPRPPPLCPGHQEPCVLRTVKIKGPNQGKQFYCCARPQGHVSNLLARCKFFKWVKQ